MRILMITPGFPSDENDHNCIPPLQLFVGELCKRGVEIHIIALEYPYKSTPYKWHEAQIYPCNGQNRKWLKYRTSYRAFSWGFKLDKQYNFDAIHSFWLTRVGAIGASIAEKIKIPHYITSMGQDALNPNLTLLNMLKKNPEAHQVVTLSRFHLDKLYESSGVMTPHCIPWGIDSNKDYKEDKERTIDVLGVGSLLPVKNWSKWLQIIQKSVEEKPNLRCMLIGDGPLRKKLEAEAKQLGIAKNVVFTGNLPRQEVLKEMRKATVLLHTSDFESFGYVFSEAYSNGCAIVTTPVGIAPEMTEEDDIDPFFLLDRGRNRDFNPKRVYSNETTVAGLSKNVNVLLQNFQPTTLNDTVLFSLTSTTNQYLQLYENK
jgi:1,2-diacylglycerol 3-alpha-glucosyltransferase